MATKKPPKVSPKKKRPLSKRDVAEKLRTRLKDTLWSLRQRFSGFPVALGVDRIMPFLTMNQELSLDQLTGLFASIERPKTKMAALILRIQAVVLAYWNFIQPEGTSAPRTGGSDTYRSIFHSILILEDIIRSGFDLFELVEDNLSGFALSRRK